MREAGHNDQIETVGRELREMMTFLKKKKEALPTFRRKISSGLPGQVDLCQERDVSERQWGSKKVSVCQTLAFFEPSASVVFPNWRTDPSITR